MFSYKGEIYNWLSHKEHTSHIQIPFSRINIFQFQIRRNTMNNINTLNIPMNDNILNAGISVRDHALQKHNKVFVQRMDVRFPLELQQKAIIKFNKRFIEKERNAGYDPDYIFVRELSKKKHIHYHMALFLDGNKTENTYQHFRNAETVLQNVIGEEYSVKGLIDRCDRGHRNGIMLNRNNPNQDDMKEVERQLSYLAKEDQKKGVKGKTFSTSRINKQK